MNEQTAAKIRTERRRQRQLWGKGAFAAMPPTWVLAILMEEVGEVAQALVDFNQHQDMARIEAEIVQVAAVAARWLDECFSEEEA